MSKPVEPTSRSRPGTVAYLASRAGGRCGWGAGGHCSGVVTSAYSSAAVGPLLVLDAGWEPDRDNTEQRKLKITC
jgi:hypothetical protein